VEWSTAAGVISGSAAVITIIVAFVTMTNKLVQRGEDMLDAQRQRDDANADRALLRAQNSTLTTRNDLLAKLVEQSADEAVKNQLAEVQNAKTADDLVDLTRRLLGPHVSGAAGSVAASDGSATTSVQPTGSPGESGPKR